MVGKRGRQPGSIIRDNMIELLYYLGSAYGYDLHKKYTAVFGPVSIRSIYHHLNKGMEMELFKIKKIEKVQGKFSWGPAVERRMYGLTKNAQPKGHINIKEILEKN